MFNLHYSLRYKKFKLIDFGRSIYKYDKHVFCSDSFQPGADAATQYNTEPYFNEKKPRLDPNFSFDLCRLGCSIYDYLVEDLDEVYELSKNVLSPGFKKLILAIETVCTWSLFATPRANLVRGNALHSKLAYITNFSCSMFLGDIVPSLEIVLLGSMYIKLF